MTEKLEKTIKDGIITLPTELQKAINSIEWVKITESVGKKFFLSDNEINLLQLETGLILLGYKKLDLFALNIESSICIDEINSKKISDELDDKIFFPIEKIIQYNIKTNQKYKNSSWDKKINFIVSGGDYSVFIEK